MSSERENTIQEILYRTEKFDKKKQYILYNLSHS